MMFNRQRISMPALRRPLPCRDEGAIKEFCTQCGVQGEMNHVRDCSIHESTTRIKCQSCDDYVAIPEDDIVYMYSSANGIGDTVNAVYAACGTANTLRLNGQGHKLVVLQSPYLDVLKPIHHPGVQFELRKDMGVNLNENYEDQLMAASLKIETHCSSRSQWFCDNVTRHGKNMPKITPARPATYTKPRPVLDGQPYILIAPFAAWHSRDWPEYRWAELTIELENAGYRVVGIGGSNQEERLRRVFALTQVTFHWGMPLDWVTSVVANAAAVIGNDSGIPHLGGLYGVPTFAVMTHMPGPFVFREAPSVKTIHADEKQWPCQGCSWRQPKYRPECDLACNALRSIQVRDVFEEFMKWQVPGRGAGRVAGPGLAAVRGRVPLAGQVTQLS